MPPISATSRSVLAASARFLLAAAISLSSSPAAHADGFDEALMLCPGDRVTCVSFVEPRERDCARDEAVRVVQLEEERPYRRPGRRFYGSQGGGEGGEAESDRMASPERRLFPLGPLGGRSSPAQALYDDVGDLLNLQSTAPVFWFDLPSRQLSSTASDPSRPPPPCSSERCPPSSPASRLLGSESLTSWTSREPRATAMADSLFRLLFPQIYDVYLDDAPTTHRCEDLDKHRSGSGVSIGFGCAIPPASYQRVLSLSDQLPSPRSPPPPLSAEHATS